MIQRSVLSPIDGHWTDLTGMNNNKWKSYNWYFSNGHLFKIDFFSCTLWKWPQRMFFPPADHLRARKWDEVLPQAVRLPHMTPVLQLGQSSTITQVKKPTLRFDHWLVEREGNFDYFFAKKTFSQHNWQRNHPVSRSKSKNFAVVSSRFIFRRRILLQINSLTL